MNIVRGDSNTVGLILNLDELATLTGLLVTTTPATRAHARANLVNFVAEGSTYVHNDPDSNFCSGLREAYCEMLEEVECTK